MRFPFFLLIVNLFIPFLPENGRRGGDEKQVIVWQANQPLTWDDFKGKPEKRFAAASTNYDILKTIRDKSNISSEVIIKAVFFCNKSWKKERWADATVLRHEQKHFDIVELYARKLRKLLKENAYASKTELHAKCDSLYSIIDKEMDQYQDRYDDETNGSMDAEQQKLWGEKISAEVKNLDMFADTLVNVTFIKK